MIVIVGSSDLWPTPDLASKILSLMVSINEDVAVRCDRLGGNPSMVEELVVKIGNRIDRRVIRYGTKPGTGSQAGFSRDVGMVKAASAVFAFLGPEAVALETGTGHVIECALRAEKPVWAFGLDSDGSIVEIAGDEARVDIMPWGSPTTDPEAYREFTWHKL